MQIAKLPEVARKKLSGIQNKIRTDKTLLRKIRIALLLALIVGILYLSRSLFVAATVNGQPISRLAVVKSLEKQGGSQVLDDLITKTLITQEARKQKLVISKADIDAEIAKIEENLKTQGMTLDSALSVRGETRTDLEEAIRINKTVELLAGKDIKITDEEIKKYFEENKETFEKGATLESVKSRIENQLKQQKLAAMYQEWIANLKTAAKINYLIKY